MLGSHMDTYSPAYSMDRYPRNYIPDGAPKDIERLIHTRGGIIGQDAAVRAASLIVYTHYEGRPSVSLFVGPTGCGKTEIWRALQKEYSADNIVIHDASTLSAEGWKGGNKISSIFRDIPPDRRGNVILVMDEFDKLLEPMYGSGGCNYSDLLQNQLLRLCDHDKLFFGSEDSRERGISVDCSGVSVVLLGAFERLYQRKSQTQKRIGFLQDTEPEESAIMPEISVEDLIAYGMRAELAGRINRIVCMEPLDADALAHIGQAYVDKLVHKMQCGVEIDPSALIMLARIAQEKGLGARWIKSRIDLMLDDMIYDDPEAECYRIEYEPPDADVRRQAACMG